jgi:hypothetical protein
MSGSTTAGSASAPTINISQYLASLPGYNSTVPISEGGSAGNPLDFAASILGPQYSPILSSEGGFQGYNQSAPPTIPASYGTGLDLSTLGGLDTLAERVAYNDPNAAYISDNLPGSNAAAQNLYSWLVQGGPTSAPANAGVNIADLLPNPGSPDYVTGPNGSLELDQTGASQAALGYGESQGVTPNVSPFLASLPLTAITLGLGAAGELAAEGGVAAADAGAGAGIGASDLGAITAGDAEFGTAAGAGAGLGAGASLGDVLATSDLGGITAGAGDAGGTALASTGAGLGASLGDTLGLLPGDIQLGVQGADAASAIAAGADPAAALTSSGVADLADISGSGGVISTAGLGIDPTVLSGADTGNVFLGAQTTADQSGGGFLSDLFSGNFGNLGSDLSNDWSSLWSGGSAPADSTPLQLGDAAGTPSAAAVNNAGVIGGNGIIQTGAGSAGGGFFSDVFNGNWSNLGSDLLGSAEKNPLGVLTTVGVLGYDLLKGNQTLPNQGALQSEAAQLAAQGTALQQYLQNGTLPPGVGQAIESAAASAKAQIKSEYAARGDSGSSAEAQDLAAVDQAAAGQGATIATQLLSEGVQETQLSSQIYGELLNLAVSQNAQLGSAIGNLAIALAGGNTRPVILQTQGAT